MPRAVANRIAVFGDAPAAGDPATIDYNVPLPNAIKGRRFVLVNLQLGQNPWLAGALQAGQDPVQLLSLAQTRAGSYSFDVSSAVQLFRGSLAQSGISTSQLTIIDEAQSLLSSQSASIGTPRGPEDASGILRVLMAQPAPAIGSSLRFPTVIAARLPLKPSVAIGSTVGPASAGVSAAPLTAGTTVGSASGSVFAAPLGVGVHLGPLSAGASIVPKLQGFLDRLGRGLLSIPAVTWSGQVELRPIPFAPASNPKVFLIEDYQITSRLGNYGLGRTVKTMSLLPGESVEVTIETWRTETSKSTYATSVFDSFSSEAASRFESEVASETSTRTTDSVATSFGADLNTKGGLNLGLVSGEASLGLSFDYETRSSREDFSSSMSRAVQSHANTTNSARESSVTSTAEQTVDQGERQRTVRTFRNVNLRRTLNFVFRDANQEFQTKVHLTGIRVGFSNVRLGSWREAPLSALRPFLQSLLQPAEVDPACQQLLKLAAVAYDAADAPVTVLETLTRQVDGRTWVAADAVPDNAGNYPLPSVDLVYRFKAGVVGQVNDQWTVPGLVLNQETVVLRTDTIIVEALIGQADALDDYALEAQEADAGAKTLANDRQNLVNVGLERLGPAERCAAHAKMFRPEDRLNVALENVP